ncbi:MAG: GAF domain-containing protein, partial [Mycobacteriales bacterium]
MQSDGDDADELRHWYSLSRDLLAVVGYDGYFLRLSQSWSETLGYPLEELLARPFADFLHPDDRTPSLQRLAEHEAHGSDTIGLVNRYVHADGSLRWLQWNGQTELSGDRVYAVARDVTESHRRNEHQVKWAAALAAVLSARTPDEILQVVTDEARTLIGTRQSVTSLTTGFGASPGPTAVALSPEYAARRGLDEGPRQSAFYAEVARTNRPMRLSQDAFEAHPLWSEYTASVLELPPMRGWLAVPTIDRNGLNLGVIQLSDKVDGTDFDESDERLIADFARLASLAIERGLARNAAASAIDRQQLVVALGQAALREESLEDVLATAVREAASLLGVSTVAVVEISTLPDSVLVSPLSAVPAGMAGASFTHEEFYPSTSATALRTGVPVAEEDYARRAHALGVAGMATYGLRSAVSVPMTSAGSFTGVLYAADAQPLRF